MLENIELEQAVALATQGIAPLGLEGGEAAGFLGRTLGRAVLAPGDLPPFGRSPLDGYALRAADAADASPAAPAVLEVVGTVFAGEAAPTAVMPGQAVRVATGAMLPPGCDCVARQEDTDRGYPAVSVFCPLRAGDNYIRRGEDCRAGDTLLPAGTRLGAACVGALAAAGIPEVFVCRRPRVGVLCTGDEVAGPAARPLPPGKIYDANLPLLTARLRELGISQVQSGRAGDGARAISAAVARMLEGCDLLITTGGVSVGERDLVPQALCLLGAERVFWRLRLKPGSPALYTRLRGKPVLSLSGNPFAALATFELLARPLLAALAGEGCLLAQRRQAVLGGPFQKASKTRRFIRGSCEEGRVRLPRGHASGSLLSCAACNCLVDIPAGTGPLNGGERLWVSLL